MNNIEKNNVQFDYFSSNYQKFLTDDILRLMVKTKKNYFRLNAINSRDKKDHYFIFKEHTHLDNTKVLRYEYIGHKSSM